MLIYWEKSANGVLEANFDTKEDNEGCQLQKPQMKNDEDKEQIIDLTVNIVFIFNFQNNNNCNSVEFGMQKSIDDMSRVSTKLVVVFIWSLRVFTQSSELWAQSSEKSIQSPYVFSQLGDKWA